MSANPSSLDLDNLVPALPLLGPLIGWTRTADAQNRPSNDWLARLWVKATDTEGQLAELALTARWDPHAQKWRGAQLWQIFVMQHVDTWPNAEERFALADLAFAAGGPDICVRMITLHRTYPGTPFDAAAGFTSPYCFLSSGVLLDGSAGAAPDNAKLASMSKLNLDGRLSRAAALAVYFPGYRMEGSPIDLDEYAATMFKRLEAEIEKKRCEKRPRPEERDAKIGDCELQVRAALAGQQGSLTLSFAAGCCRHPGMQFDRALSDRALGALARRVREGDPSRFAFMLGDQIYADATGGVLDVSDSLEKYATRYHTAFRSPMFRRLTRLLPTYMVADDHEIRDGWPSEAAGPAKKRDAPLEGDVDAQWAWLMFLAHQRFHGPEADDWAVGEEVSGRPSFWYAFESAGVPFFVFDTRFERTLIPDSDIVKEPQLSAFHFWLEHVKQLESENPELRFVPKFIVSGSVFAPGESEFTQAAGDYARRADSWMGYVASRGKILEAILGSQLQNFVFLSGDYHCCAAGSLEVQGTGANAGASLQAYCIVAPPFYSAFPFADLPARRVELNEDSTFPQSPIRLRCTAQAFDMQGFAVISVRKKAADPPQSASDWQVDVDFYADEWEPPDQAGCREPTSRLHRSIRLL